MKNKLKSREEEEFFRLKRLALGIAIFLITTAGPTYRFWFPSDPKVELSDEDRLKLDEILEIISESEELKASNKRFFKAISNDPAVSGVGICKSPDEMPFVLVPSSEFAERSGLWEPEDDALERTSERLADVVLESPNLSSEDRKWRFLDVNTGKSFYAKMRDDDFVKSLTEGRVNENLRTNIKMKVNVSYKERRENGEWVIVSATTEVTKVTLEGPASE
ncbi:hypothetical protein GCM10009069_08730 [Algimonas arctica]|uniref:Uncharacterized protein n=1 Tax=Algimonas arctica TaxID=1479486 RepID=A0A8J3CQZ3_9PROT|nr:hypothetical protein [Algimonas arctica]GHA88033.1 hypothetical protein GCM10009069_08730 [Algimonas arctica]